MTTFRSPSRTSATRDAGRIRGAGRAGHRARRRAHAARRVLSRVLRARLPGAGKHGAASGLRVSRRRVVRASPRRPRRANVAVVLGTERVVDGALCRDGARHQSGRHDRRLPGQGAARSIGGADLLAGLDRRVFHGRPADVRRGDLPRRVALPGDGPLGRAARRAGRVPPALPRGGARRLPAGRRSPTPRTRSTRRRCCAAPPRTPATSRPSTTRARDRRRRRRWFGRTGRCWCYQPYGEEGLLVADLDLAAATGLLASRCKYA